jgi:N-methylhydantoinase B
MGAIYGYDGWDGLCWVLGAGGSLRAPIEPEEWETPYRWLHHEFIMDSAGDGKWRGGMGVHWEALNTYNRKVWQAHDCVVMTGNSDGEKFTALGVMGGGEGKKHRLGIIRKGKRVKLRCNDVQYVQPDDILWSRTGGGGGVGNPLDRDVERVRWDVLNEYISSGKARNVYGVVLRKDADEVDVKATKELRKKLKAALKGGAGAKSKRKN